MTGAGATAGRNLPGRTGARRRTARWIELACCGAAGLALLVLVLLIGAVLWKGAGAVRPAFLWQPSTDAGVGGGVRYQLVGTVWMTACAAALVVPLALAVALVATQFAGQRLASLARSGLQLLNAVPSILFGLFGFVVFVHGLGWGKSWLTGSVLLAWMILPTVSVTLSEAMEAVPREVTDAARALGLSRGRCAWQVVVPHSLHGLWRGLLLGVARAAGETAPLLFTAVVFSGATVPNGIRNEPVLALPYHVFVLSQDSYDPAAETAAWGAALALLGVVLLMLTLALPLRRRAFEEARG